MSWDLPRKLSPSTKSYVPSGSHHTLPQLSGANFLSQDLIQAPFTPNPSDGGLRFKEHLTALCFPTLDKPQFPFLPTMPCAGGPETMKCRVKSEMSDTAQVGGNQPLQGLTCGFIQFFKVSLWQPNLMDCQVYGATATVHNHVFVTWLKKQNKTAILYIDACQPILNRAGGDDMAHPALFISCTASYSGLKGRQ